MVLVSLFARLSSSSNQKGKVRRGIRSSRGIRRSRSDCLFSRSQDTIQHHQRRTGPRTHEHIHLGPTFNRKRTIRDLETNDTRGMDASHEPDQWYQRYKLLHDLCLHPRSQFRYTSVPPSFHLSSLRALTKL